MPMPHLNKFPQSLHSHFGSSSETQQPPKTISFLSNLDLVLSIRSGAYPYRIFAMFLPLQDGQTVNFFYSSIHTNNLHCKKNSCVYYYPIGTLVFLPIIETYLYFYKQVYKFCTSTFSLLSTSINHYLLSSNLHVWQSSVLWF